MGIINVAKGLSGRPKAHIFNGSIRDNLDLNWEYAKIYSGGNIGHEELPPDYKVKDDDIIFIREYPGEGASAVALIIAIVSLVAAGITSGIAIYKAKQAEKDLRNQLEKSKKKSNKGETDSIPWLSGAKNERAEGKQAPVITGRHLFTPYYLSDPYLKPEGKDGEDLYWYGTFLCGQSGLAFEKVRNGMNDLAVMNNVTPTVNTYRFGDIGVLSSSAPTPDRRWNADTAWLDFLSNFIDMSSPDGHEEIMLNYGGTFGGDAIVPAAIIIRWNQEVINNWSGRRATGYHVAFATTKGDVVVQRIGITNPALGYPLVIYGRPAADTPLGDNRIHIIQNGYFSDGENSRLLDGDDLEVFDQKWADSLETITELGRKKSEDGDAYNGFMVINDEEEPVIRESARYPYKIEIEIMADGLLGWDSAEAEMVDASVGIELSWARDIKTLEEGNGAKIRYEYEDERTWREDVMWGYRGLFLTRNNNRQMRFIFTVDLSKYPDIYDDVGSPVYIMAVRKTPMYAAGYKDKVYLMAIRTQQYSPKESTKTELIPAKNINKRLAGKFCRMGVKIKANINTEDSLDRFNIVASSTARTWNGFEWSEFKTATSNPAALALEVLTGLNHELSEYKDSEIDMESFGRLFDYCQIRREDDGDNIATIGPEIEIEGQGGRFFNIEANGVAATAVKKLDIVKSILGTCDAGLYVNEFGILETYYDDYQSFPIGLLNAQRIIAISETRNMDRKPDGYKFEFIDEDADWQADTRRILRPLVEEEPGQHYAPVKLEYITNYKQAAWMVRRMMAKEIHRPGELKITVGMEGRLFKPGSLVKVQHEGLKLGIGSGEIAGTILNKEKTHVTGFRLMERFNINAGSDYYIDYYVVDGERNHVVSKQLKPVGESIYTDILEFTVGIPVGSPDVPVMGNILSVMRISEYGRYLVLGMSEVHLGYDLLLAAYDEEIYKTGPIKPYISRILPANPPVFSDRQGQIRDQRITDMMDRASPDRQDQFITRVTEREIPLRAPRYRGVMIDPDTENTGIVNHQEMNKNDIVLYKGDDFGGWLNSRVYRWLGDRWEMLAPPTASNRQNANEYLIANGDVTSGAPPALFSFAQIGSLVTDALFAELVSALNIELRQIPNPNNLNEMMSGSIHSSGFVSQADATPQNPAKGFIIRHNGDTEFNNIRARGYIEAIGGTFSGELKAATGTFTGALQAASGTFKGDLTVESTIKGTLDGRNLVTSGEVSHGDAYVLKSNNSIAIIQPSAISWYFNILRTIPTKILRVFATGSCILRAEFPRDSIDGYFTIKVNGDILTDHDTVGVGYYGGSKDIFTPTINLSRPANDPRGNVVELYMWPRSAGVMFINTIFELQCAQNPGLLGALG